MRHLIYLVFFLIPVTANCDPYYLSHCYPLDYNCAAYIRLYLASEGGYAQLYAGGDGYLSYGTQGGGNIFEVVGNRTVRKVANNGKVELNYDSNDAYRTHDMSMMDDRDRIKIGGGKDTDTASGARIMLHGNLNNAAHGQAVMSAGATSSYLGNADTQVSAPAMILETRGPWDIFQRTDDKTRFRLRGRDPGDGSAGKAGDLVGDPTHGGSVVLTNPTAGLSLRKTSNSRLNTVSLTAGSATVANTSVTDNTIIFLSGTSESGTPGRLRIASQTAGQGFVIASSSNQDTSTVSYLLIESN